jgi:hypothetical protein
MVELLKALDRPVTWRSIVRIALGFAAEGALLALIWGSPVVLQVGTVICAVLVLAALESEAWLTQRWRYSFPSILVVLGIIYLGCIGYGIYTYFNRIEIQRGLKDIYTKSSQLVTNTFSPSDVVGGILTPTARTAFITKARDWETKSAQWIEEQIGPPARERFLDQANAPTYGWTITPESGVIDMGYADIMNRLMAERKNLATMIESGAWAN